MKIFARQIAPEYQESPLFLNDESFPDNIAVCGNREYRKHLPPIFKRVCDVLADEELADFLENPKGWDLYKNKTDAIMDCLWPENGDKYSTKAIHDLGELVVQFSTCRSCEENDILCKILSIVSGQKWDHSIIRGSGQSDWQEIFFPVDEWSHDSLSAFETQYWNKGTEWIIHDEDTEPESQEEISGYSVYCVGWNEDQIRKELADASGEAPENIVMYAFTGWSRTANYREVV